MNKDSNRRPNRKPFRRGPAGPADRVLLYGLHTVAAALANPRRHKRRLMVTRNALPRLEAILEGPAPLEPEFVEPRAIDKLLPADAVHQGIVLEADPLPPLPMDDLAGARLVLLLDQITDPHNVGAILRSATAFAADAVIITGRHSPAESGVLAKSASGALDIVPVMTVPNLARTLIELGERGFTRLGLDSEGPVSLDEVAPAGPVAVVLGAEGKGLRQLTRETCDVMARLDMPGEIKSLNVSNAAAIVLYALTRNRSA
ncbi:MAG: 23S rRNA (guanosine(2251)-2'-O)-methyltransferase RlmB [Hyphomicrobiales bacterium]